MKISIGIEGTFAPHSGKDTLRTTGHDECHRQDFQLIKSLGVQEFRYPIPWHSIEAQRGIYDWSFMDQVKEVVHEDLGLSMIADTLHHTSYPSWLERGFLSADFVGAYATFVQRFAERYPFVTVYTPFNEPTCTLDFCGDRGFWHPYGRGDVAYVRMLRNTARGTAEAIHQVLKVNPKAGILHVDTFEHHSALDPESEERAQFLNERRFLFEELIAGSVSDSHCLYGYLVGNGFSPEDLTWHLEHPVRITERGGNYYPLSEEQLAGGQTANAPSKKPKGFAGVVAEYAKRISVPLSLTETNIQGTVADRISWLKYMLEQAEQLGGMGIHLKQFAWYPLFDCAGWHCLLQDLNWNRDPQGIYSCDSSWQRISTALSRAYESVVHGATSTTLPAYRFGARHARTLGSLIPQMNWAWEDAPVDLVGEEC